MKEHLDSLQKQLAEKVRQRQADLADEKRQLHAKQTELDEQDLPLMQAMLRANGPAKPDACPICWVWDAKVIKPHPTDGNDQFDRFRCGECGHEFELPID